MKSTKQGWRKTDLRAQITALLTLGLLSYIAIQLVGDADLGERRVFIRLWNCVACGFFAIAVPHLLFPDADLYLIRTINLSKKQLLWRQFRKIGLALIISGFPSVVLVFYGLDNVVRNAANGLILLAESWLFLLGAGCYALQKYATIGGRSQEVAEGKRGGVYRILKTPGGLAPTLTATAAILFWGFHTVVLGAALNHFYDADFDWLPGLLLLGWAALRTAFRMKAYDRHFYCTDAFYSEAYRDPQMLAENQYEPIVYDSLFWVPRPWRPHVWAGIVQLDRRLPLAIFIALGHLFLWFLFYFHTSDSLITAYLLLFLALKNGASSLIADESAAPLPFQVALQSGPNWVGTRVFINLRWTFPFILSLTGIALIWDNFTLAEMGGWIGFDLFLAFLSALLSTYFYESQFQNRYG